MTQEPLNIQLLNVITLKHIALKFKVLPMLLSNILRLNFFPTRTFLQKIILASHTDSPFGLTNVQVNTSQEEKSQSLAIPLTVNRIIKRYLKTN